MNQLLRIEDFLELDARHVNLEVTHLGAKNLVHQKSTALALLPEGEYQHTWTLLFHFFLTKQVSKND